MPSRSIKELEDRLETELTARDFNILEREFLEIRITVPTLVPCHTNTE